MAISFTGIDEGKLIDEYNNSIITFWNTSGLYPTVKGSITIEGNTFEVTPRVITGVGAERLAFNFKEIVKVLLKYNERDTVSYDFNTIIYKDNRLFLHTVVDYVITKSDASTVSESKTYSWLKSVSQLGAEERLDSENYLLNQSNLTFFKGYPFDLSFYIAALGNISILNTQTNAATSLTVNSPLGVNRFTLSSGKYLRSVDNNCQTFVDRVEALSGGEIVDNCCYTFEEDYFLNVGVNPVRFDANGTVFNTQIKLIDNQSGVYLKWLNDEGNFSYWLFSEIHTESVKTKTADVYNSEAQNLVDAYQEKQITGKTAENILNLNYKNLTNDEVYQLKSLLTSSYVMMYTGENNELYDYTNWQTVTIKDGTFSLVNTKRNLQNISIRVEKNQYTQI